jgi:hypothetical protein
VSSDATEREVPTGAIVTALAMTEALSDRQVAPLEEFAAAVAGAIQQWGHDTIIDGFSMLLGVGMSYLSDLQFEDEPTCADERPTLRVVLPALLTRLERAGTPEVPPAVLPTVSGMLPAAALYSVRQAALALPRVVTDDAGGRVDQAVVRECRAALTRLYDLDYRLGGADVYALTVHMVDRMRNALARASYRPEIGAALQEITAAASTNTRRPHSPNRINKPHRIRTRPGRVPGRGTRLAGRR